MFQQHILAPLHLEAPISLCLRDGQARAGVVKILIICGFVLPLLDVGFIYNCRRGGTLLSFPQLRLRHGQHELVPTACTESGLIRRFHQF